MNLKGEVSDLISGSVENYSKIQSKFVDAFIKTIKENQDGELEDLLIEVCL